MEIKDSHIILMFVALTLIVGLTLIQIYTFMPVIDSCEDDFAVIEKCHCLPWKTSLTFPQFIKNNTFTPNG
jgi:hypothetical protein